MIKNEMIKILSKKINKTIILVAIVFSITFSLFAINSNTYVDNQGMEHRNLFSTRMLSEEKNKVKGELTNEKLKIIADNYRKTDKLYPKSVPNNIYSKKIQAYTDIHDMINYILKGDGEFDPDAILSTSEENLNNIYKIREDNIKKDILAYGKTHEKKRYLENTYNKIKVPFYYEGYDSWTTSSQYVTNVQLMLVLLVSLPAAAIFSDEFRNNTESVYFSSRYGRTKAIGAKIGAGIIFTSLFYWSCILIFSIISFIFMGISGAKASYQIAFGYSMYNMKFYQEYLLIVFSGYIASLLSVSSAMLIASKTKSTGVSVIVSFILFAVSPFIGRVLPFKVLFELTPDQLCNVLNVARMPNIYQVGDIVIRQIPLVLGIYISVFVLLIPLVYHTYKNICEG